MLLPGLMGGLLLGGQGGGGGATPSAFTTDELTPKWLASGSPSTLIVADGAAAAWDESIREIGNVIDEGSAGAQRYKLTYTGHPGSSTSGNDVYVGYAYSSDGASWTKGGQLVLGSVGGSPDPGRSSEDPWVIKVGSTYYLYVEDKETVPFTSVRLYTSTDFSTWTDQGVVLAPGTAGAWDDQDVSSVVVWREGSDWKMLYEGRQTSGQQGAIGLATSSDGSTWAKDGANPVLTAAAFSWASAVVPDDLMVAADGTYVLLLHGLTATNFFRSTVAHGSDLYTWSNQLGAHPIRMDDVSDHYTVHLHPVGADMDFIYARDAGAGIRQGDDMTFEALVVNFTGSDGSTTFTDESLWGHTLTANGNAQIQSNKLELDGAGDFISSPDVPRWHIGGVDFTIEAFGVEFQSSPSNEPIVGQYDSNTNQRGYLFTYISGELRFYVSSNGSSLTLIASGTWAPTVDTAYDIAVERSGSTFRLYVDGAMLASATSSIAAHNSTDVFAIGRQNGGTPVYADIRMTAFRFTNGEALYATDTSYTVPSLPLS